MKFLLLLLLCFLVSVSASENQQISLNLKQNASRKLTETGKKCTQGEIVIAQSQIGTLFGSPIYKVEITNTCASGNTISNLHLHCGWFSSATLINPKTFKRLAYDDCLVNDGQPIAAGLTVSFQYTTTFKYPLSVKTFN